tara:strand:+ start:66 stop:215 length:150 start_codon:yes stop_codon:yes gene_type:complete
VQTASITDGNNRLTLQKSRDAPNAKSSITVPKSAKPSTGEKFISIIVDF